MYIKRNYGFWQTFGWSIKSFIVGLAYSSVVYAFYLCIKYEFGVSIALPWNPIGIIGIAVAFYLGFKNNASYDRTWEARKIWGGIVNNSRTFGAAINSFIEGDNAETIKKRLIYRHIAWLTVLRFQLRLSREWEHVSERFPNAYPATQSDEYYKNLSIALAPYLSEKEINDCLKKTNAATHLLAVQSAEMQELKNKGYFDDFRHMEFHKLIASFYDEQGRSERIKNFPFPRQYASVALWLAVIFAALIPFGLLDILGELPLSKQWILIPLTALIIWIFFLMEKIGDYSENPFENSFNDIPIASISRSIEIDMRELLNDSDIPPAIKSEDGFLM